DVRQPVHHPGIRGKTVSTRTPGLLVIPLDTLRKVNVRHKPDIGLVDAHPECNRSDHDDAVFANESVLIGLARAVVQARVVRQSIYALTEQIFRGLVHGISRQAVDNASVARVLGLDKFQELLARADLFRDPIPDVRTIEAGYENARVLQMQAIYDFLSG